MRITADFLCENIVTFRPQNRDEAAAIQRALFELGPVWSLGVPEVLYLQQAVREGMTVADGQIFIGIDPRDAKVAVACTAADLGIKESVTAPPVRITACTAPKVTL